MKDSGTANGAKPTLPPPPPTAGAGAAPPSPGPALKVSVAVEESDGDGRRPSDVGALASGGVGYQRRNLLSSYGGSLNNLAALEDSGRGRPLHQLPAPVLRRLRDKSMSASNLAAAVDGKLSLQLAVPERSYDSPHSRTAAVRDRFSGMVARYYAQMTQGCDERNCSNAFCANFRGGRRQFTPDVAAVVAVHLASRRRVYFCNSGSSSGNNVDINGGDGNSSSSSSSSSASASASASSSSAIISEALRRAMSSRVSASASARSAGDRSGPDVGKESQGRDGRAASRTVLPSGVFSRHEEDDAMTTPEMRAARAAALPQRSPFLHSVFSASPFDFLFAGVQRGQQGRPQHERQQKRRSWGKVTAMDDLATTTAINAGGGVHVRGRPSSTMRQGSWRSCVDLRTAEKDEVLLRSRNRPGVATAGSDSASDGGDGVDGELSRIPASSRTAMRTAVDPSAAAVEGEGDDASLASESASSAGGGGGDPRAGRELSLTHLTLASLQEAIRGFQSTGDAAFLLNTVRTVFSSERSLESSFRAAMHSEAGEAAVGKSVRGDGDEGGHGLDLESIGAAYAEILSLEPSATFRSTLINACEISLARLESCAPVWSTPSQRTGRSQRPQGESGSEQDRLRPHPDQQSVEAQRPSTLGSSESGPGGRAHDGDAGSASAAARGPTGENWLRQLLILLENPLLLDTHQSFHSTLLLRLCNLLGGEVLLASPVGRRTLLRWLSSYPRPSFSRLVQLLQYHVTHALNTSHQRRRRPERPLVCAMRALSVLNVANEWDGGRCADDVAAAARLSSVGLGVGDAGAAGGRAPIVPYTMFHNDAIVRECDFKEEYRIWKHERCFAVDWAGDSACACCRCRHCECQRDDDAPPALGGYRRVNYAAAVADSPARVRPRLQSSQKNKGKDPAVEGVSSPSAGAAAATGTDAPPASVAASPAGATAQPSPGGRVSGGPRAGFQKPPLRRRNTVKYHTRTHTRTHSYAPCSLRNGHDGSGASASSAAAKTAAGGGGASFFEFPFFLDATSKTRVLHIHAVLQMSKVFEQAFVHSAWVFQVQKILEENQRITDIKGDIRKVTCPYLVLEVRRGEHLISDTLSQLEAKQDDLKKPLKVKYVGGGEEGLDLGGVQKDFFQSIIAQIFDPAYGMFTPTEESSGTRTFFFNGESLEDRRQFELVGTVIGLAIYNGVIVNVQFPLVLYRMLLGHAPTLEDLKDAMPQLGKGLQQLLDYPHDDVEDVFCRTFQISYKAFGRVKVVELLPNGDDVPVTSQNKHLFVALYVRHILKDAVRTQLQAFARGFHKVCGGHALQLCRAEELEVLVCGARDLDFAALERVAEYDDGYHANHRVIRWFWQCVHSWSDARKRQLLVFVTGSDRVPVRGLQSLTFVVQRNGPDSDR